MKEVSKEGSQVALNILRRRFFHPSFLVSLPSIYNEKPTAEVSYI